MMVKLVGDLGFLVATLGMGTFSIIYLITVRWWTDHLGRAIAAVVGVIALIMALSTVRVLGFPLPGLMWWRAILFPTLAIALWSATVGFVWAQFLAPRIRKRRKGKS